MWTLALSATVFALGAWAGVGPRSKGGYTEDGSHWKVTRARVAARAGTLAAVTMVGSLGGGAGEMGDEETG